MPELLLELFSEEIPARMQRRAAADLQRLVCAGLSAAGLEVGEAEAFATPRRLALVIRDLPAKSPAVTNERRRQELPMIWRIMCWARVSNPCGSDTVSCIL